MYYPKPDSSRVLLFTLNPAVLIIAPEVFFLEANDHVPEVFRLLRKEIGKLLADQVLSAESAEKVKISCRTLTPEEALGNPERDDFPLQKGREKLMQAEIGEYCGQAFTDRPGNLAGTVEEILNLPPVNNHHRAAIVATLNAFLRKIGRINCTVHCKDEGPALCSGELADELKRQYGNPKIVMIGLQPAMAEVLAKKFPLKIMDLDPDNADKTFGEVRVETNPYDVAELEKWADLFFVTGSTVVNGSIDQFLDLKKPVIYFGTTIAGPAELLGLKRICPRSS